MDKIRIRSKEEELRKLVREESRYGALQAHFMLLGTDLDEIVDNEVIEYKAKEKATTPLTNNLYKNDKRKDLLLKGSVIGFLIILVVFDLVDVSLIRLLVDIFI